MWLASGGATMAEHDHVPAYVQKHGPLETPVRVLRFASEIAALKREPGYQHGNRLARTVAKEGPLTVVLSIMRAGARAQEHRAAGPIALQCLEGTLRLHHGGHSLDLTPGELLVLDAGIPHSHEALTDCAFLLTLPSVAPVQPVE
jgi:quercetin dioxygenase-like cupin family protein